MVMKHFPLKRTLFVALLFLLPAAAMSPQAVGPAGGTQPHENMLPFLCINFIIALEGIFPSQN